MRNIANGIFHVLLPLLPFLPLTCQPHYTICCFHPCFCLVSELTHTVPSFWKTAFPSILTTANPALVSPTTGISFKAHLRSYLPTRALLFFPTGWESLKPSPLLWHLPSPAWCYNVGTGIAVALRVNLLNSGTVRQVSGEGLRSKSHCLGQVQSLTSHGSLGRLFKISSLSFAS